MNKIIPYGVGASISLKLMSARLGHLDKPHYYNNTVDDINSKAKQLIVNGGLEQQHRMIRDKRKALNKATLYSYQGAWVKKVQDIKNSGNENERSFPVRALINPDKNKFDYDDKIISIGFEHGFQPGDVFEWCQTNSYWLITLQELNELAYFRGNIRRCDYQINWIDENGIEQNTYAAIRGPVETKIDFIQKHQISIDEPNHSLHILMPKTEKTIKQFQRYNKFYLKAIDTINKNICWRVEAIDTISTKNILEITAVEYYANESEDNIEEGLVGAYIKHNDEPEFNPEIDIKGPTFIKPKIEYEYLIETQIQGEWYIEGPKVPVSLIKFKTDRGIPGVKLKWNTSYSGQFTLQYGNKEKQYEEKFSKTIVVESLF